MNRDEVNELTPEVVRREAEARSLTLDPVNPTVSPEEEPDSVQAARRANGPAIANMPNDTEQNTPSIQPASPPQAEDRSRPSLSPHVNSAAVAALVFLVGIVAVIIIYVLV